MKSYDDLLRQAEVYRGGTRDDLALACLADAAAQDPARSEAYYRQALIYHARGDRAAAVRLFLAAAQRAPSDPSIHHNLGVIHFQGGDLPAAETSLRHALSLEPDYAEALYALGRVCQKQNRSGEAADLFRRSFAADPRNGRAFDQWQSLTPKPQRRPLRIGFVSVWFERGQAYVTRTLRDACAGEHETFVLAREGQVYGKSMLETAGPWHVPNLTVHETYIIPPEVMTRWIQQNRLDVVMFNEEYDWNLVRAARAAGAAAWTYLDYYKDDWQPFMSLYDGVLCSTLRTYHMVRKLSRAHFIGWGMPPDVFRPRPGEAQYTFFHNAGWLGINFRKMTPAVILAFDAISKLDPSLSLLVHAQVPIEQLPPVAARMVRENPHITYRAETVGAPGLYHLGRIYVYPSKLDGLGLSLLEAMSCGMPVIATDAPPMNEFITHESNGLLVRVAGTITRQDNIAFPETVVDVNDLAAKMYRLGRDAALTETMGAQARRDIVERFNTGLLARRTLAALAEVPARPDEAAA